MKSAEREHYGMAVCCARRFQGRGVPMEELIGEAEAALLWAASRFDENRGVRFSTYAVPVVLGALRDLCRRAQPMHVPRSDLRLLSAAQRARERGDVRLLGKSLGNVLEPVSRRLRPEIDKAILDIEAAGAVKARMTGSGSAVFGVFLHAGACRKAAQELQKTYPTCRMMRTAECGVVIEEEA